MRSRYRGACQAKCGNNWLYRSCWCFYRWALSLWVVTRGKTFPRGSRRMLFFMFSLFLFHFPQHHHLHRHHCHAKQTQQGFVSNSYSTSPVEMSYCLVNWKKYIYTFCLCIFLFLLLPPVFYIVFCVKTLLFVIMSVGVFSGRVDYFIVITVTSITITQVCVTHIQTCYI